MYLFIYLFIYFIFNVSINKESRLPAYTDYVMHYIEIFSYSLATYEVGENENDVSSASENGSAC